MDDWNLDNNSLSKRGNVLTVDCLHYLWHLVSQVLIVLLNTNCKPWYSFTNTKCKPNIIRHSAFLVSFFWGNIDLKCCNYYHLLSDFSSKFQLSNGQWPNSSFIYDNILKHIHKECHLNNYHSGIKYDI